MVYDDTPLVKYVPNPELNQALEEFIKKSFSNVTSDEDFNTVAKEFLDIVEKYEKDENIVKFHRARIESARKSQKKLEELAGIIVDALFGVEQPPRLYKKPPSKSKGG